MEFWYCKIITRNKYVSFGRSIIKKISQDRLLLEQVFACKKNLLKNEFEKPGLKVVFEKKPRFANTLMENGKGVYAHKFFIFNQKSDAKCKN